MLKDIWRVLTGQLSWNMLTNLQRRCRDYETQIAKMMELPQDLVTARAGIESLKHLQKYEGMQKIESDNLAAKAVETMLREQIAKLTAELEMLRATNR